MDVILFDKINNGFENAGKSIRRVVTKATTKGGIWTIGIILALLFGVISFLRGCFQKD